MTVMDMTWDGDARHRANRLLVFADGFEDAGHPELASRSRVVARDVLRLAEELEAERSTRQAMQSQRDEALEILGQHAYEALRRV